MSLESTTAAIGEKLGTDSGLGATIKFVCPDDGIIYVDGASSPNSVSNDDKDADCTITMSLGDLESMLSGDLNPTAAFMQGKLKVDGDMSVAMKLSSVVG